METAQETTRTSQNQREVILDLPHPLPPRQDRFKQFPHPRHEKLDLTRGLRTRGMVTGQIEPRIKRKTGIVQLIIVLKFLFMQIMT